GGQVVGSLGGEGGGVPGAGLRVVDEGLARCTYQFGQPSLSYVEPAPDFEKAGSPIRWHMRQFRRSWPGCESGVRPSVVPFLEGTPRRKCRSRDRVPKHHSIFVDDLEAAATSRISQRAHVHGELCCKSLEWPQSMWIVGGRKRPRFIQPRVEHGPPPGVPRSVRFLRHAEHPRKLGL